MLLHDPSGEEKDGTLHDYLVRHVFLTADPESAARWYYVNGGLKVEEYESLLDAVILGKGCEAAVRCPRCGELVRGIGSTSDRSMIAVRCDTPDCNFVGYAES